MRLTDIIETDKKAELVCHYCNKKYIFCIDELNQLLEEERKESKCKKQLLL